MKLNYKILLNICCIFGLFLAPVLAQENQAEFKLYPQTGWIEHGKEFTIDILIDTKGQDISLARSVLSFDPNLIQIVEAQRNEELFCTWPEDEQTIDNVNGFVIATGFCNSPLYATGEEVDIFARITLVSAQEAVLNLEWEYSGRDEPFTSVMMKDGSPPQNILEQPIKGEYIISVENPYEQQAEITPQTGIFSQTLLLGFAILLLAVGLYIFFNPRGRYFNKSKTVVIYEKA